MVTGRALPKVSPPSQLIPRPAAALRDPIAVARAWAYAANSTTSRDPQPGGWTRRARPFVGGGELAVERSASTGGGGQLWRDMQTRHCVITLTDLRTTTPTDAQRTSTSRVVYLTGTTILTCADRTEHDNRFAAQAIVQLHASRWQVITVAH